VPAFRLAVVEDDVPVVERRIAFAGGKKCCGACEAEKHEDEQLRRQPVHLYLHKRGQRTFHKRGQRLFSQNDL
jgi:hypothetical protein